MTRNLFVGSLMMFVLMGVLIVSGFSSAAAGSVALGLFCIMPLAFMALGAGISRFVSEFEITRRNAPTRSANKQAGVRGAAPGQVLQ